MNPELMLPPGLRNEPEEPNAFSHVAQFNVSDRVGRSIHNPLAKPRVARFHPVFHTPMPPVWCIDNVCHRKVLPLDPLGEKPMVMPPGSGLNGEEDNSSGLSVEPVHRREIGQAGALLQVDQQRALDMFPGRRHRYPVGLVGDENVFIAVNDERLLDQCGFRWNLLPIEDGDAVAVGRILSKRRAIAESDETA